MPATFHSPIGRRQFLTQSAKALAAGAVAANWQAPRAADAAGSGPVHFALVSDTHIPANPEEDYRKFRPTENLKTVVSQILEARPEAVFVDGDVARLTGELEDYQAIKAILSPLAEQCPIHLGLGNHDNRENFFKVFPSPPALAQKVTDKHVLVIERPAVRVIVLDSLLYVNKVAGLLGKAQRTWLDLALAQYDSRPTVLFVHHTLTDEDGSLLDAHALFSIVRPYSKVKAIFYGHSHQYNYQEENGIHLVNLPAVGYNFSDKEPVGWVDAQFSPGGVELTLRAIGGSREQDGKRTSLKWRRL
jgi:3',5'-cyclic-AMP phosphodiesterase